VGRGLVNSPQRVPGSWYTNQIALRLGFCARRKFLLGVQQCMWLDLRKGGTWSRIKIEFFAVISKQTMKGAQQSVDQVSISYGYLFEDVHACTFCMEHWNLYLHSVLCAKCPHPPFCQILSHIISSHALIIPRWRLHFCYVTTFHLHNQTLPTDLPSLGKGSGHARLVWEQNEPDIPTLIQVPESWLFCKLIIIDEQVPATLDGSLKQ
jgi:hypothetical protein